MPRARAGPPASTASSQVPADVIMATCPPPDARKRDGGPHLGAHAARGNWPSARCRSASSTDISVHRPLAAACRSRASTASTPVTQDSASAPSAVGELRGRVVLVDHGVDADERPAASVATGDAAAAGRDDDVPGREEGPRSARDLDEPAGRGDGTTRR